MRYELYWFMFYHSIKQILKYRERIQPLFSRLMQLQCYRSFLWSLRGRVRNYLFIRHFLIIFIGTFNKTGILTTLVETETYMTRTALLSTNMMEILCYIEISMIMDNGLTPGIWKLMKLITIILWENWRTIM